MIDKLKTHPLYVTWFERKMFFYQINFPHGKTNELIGLGLSIPEVMSRYVKPAGILILTTVGN